MSMWELLGGIVALVTAGALAILFLGYRNAVRRALRDERLP